MPKADARAVAPVCLALGRVAGAHEGAAAALLERTRHKTPRIREAVAEAIGMLDAPEAFAELERLATKDLNVGVRKAAMRGLGHLGTAEARALLAKVLASDKAGSIRELAQETLDRMK